MADPSEEHTTYTKALEREIAAWVAAGRAASNEIVALRHSLTEAIRQRDEAVRLLRPFVPDSPTCREFKCEELHHSNDGEPDRAKRCFLCIECPEYAIDHDQAAARAFLANFKEDSTND